MNSFDCQDPNASENLCLEYKLGNAICDDVCNTPEQGYDLGDCCEATCQDPPGAPGLCGLWPPYDCLDPAGLLEACALEVLGDGVCDAQNDSALCAFDGGDCAAAGQGLAPHQAHSVGGNALGQSVCVLRTSGELACFSGFEALVDGVPAGVGYQSIST